MICIISPDPSPFLPSRMSFSSGEEGCSTGNDRPTLPSIRDLFSAEELSGSPRIPLESPSLTLSRLRVSDDDGTSMRGVASPGPSYLQGPSTKARAHYEYTSPAMSRSLFEPSPAPYYGQTRSRSYTDLPFSQRSDYPLTGRSMTYDASSLRHVYGSPLPHRNTIATGDHRYDSRTSRYLYDEPSPSPYSRLVPHAITSSPSSFPQRPLATITTSVEPRKTDDDDQTPIALYRESGPSFGRPSEEKPTPSHSKYECNYCGKGFNRPSSLKIHINSHTGEKPFVCNFEGCGRSFSVLSNMRRHQRVHTQPPSRQQPHDSSDEAPSPPSTASSIPSRISNARWKHRRGSSASTSSASTSSASQSRSVSSDDDDEAELGRREKRSRHFP